MTSGRRQVLHGGKAGVLLTGFILLLPWAVFSVLAQEDPQIVGGVQSQTLSLGATANLTCTVRNKGTHTLHWKQSFNGELLPLSIDESIVAKNPVEGEPPNNKTKYELHKIVNGGRNLTYKLTINRLQALDVGLYQCSLRSGNIVLQANGTLSLIGISEGPRIVNTIGTVQGRVNGSAILLCLVADKGNNFVKWKRLRDNREITSDGSVVISNPVTDGTRKFQVVMTTQTTGVQFALTINHLSEVDSGEYQCFVQTSQAPYPSQTGTLVTGVPPVITTRTPENMTITAGQSVTLDCTATGVPQPPVTWSRLNGASLPNGQPTLQGTSLTITNMNKDQRGLYQCQALNGVYPDAARVFRVLVVFTPTATPLIKDLTQALGFSVTMECIMEGYPDIVPKWYKMVGNNKIPVAARDNYVITHSVGNGVSAQLNYNRFSLYIQKLTREDIGQYRCEGVSGSSTAFGEIMLTESATCVGGGCRDPVTNPSVTQAPDHTKCTGENCTGSSGRLGSLVPLLIVVVLVELTLSL